MLQHTAVPSFDRCTRLLIHTALLQVPAAAGAVPAPRRTPLLRRRPSFAALLRLLASTAGSPWDACSAYEFCTPARNCVQNMGSFACTKNVASGNSMVGTSLVAPRCTTGPRPDLRRCLRATACLALSTTNVVSAESTPSNSWHASLQQLWTTARNPAHGGEYVVEQSSWHPRLRDHSARTAAQSRAGCHTSWQSRQAPQRGGAVALPACIDAVLPPASGRLAVRHHPRQGGTTLA